MKKTRKIIILIFTLAVLGYTLGYRLDSKKHNLDHYPMAFAHRGIRNYYPENSKEGFLLADKLGFKAIETDISITKDHYAIIFHDDNCLRLLGIDTLIEDVDYGFLKNKFLLYKGQKTTNQVLLLSDFLKNMQTDKTIYLDIKYPDQQLADSIIDILKTTGKYSTTIIADDNIFFLGYLKYKNPDIRTDLEGFNKGKEFLHYLIPQKYQTDFYSSFFDEVDSNHVAFLRKNKLLQNKIVYGIEKSNFEAVINSGIKNVIIDFDSSMIDYKHITQKLNNNTND